MKMFGWLEPVLLSPRDAGWVGGGGAAPAEAPAVPAEPAAPAPAAPPPAGTTGAAPAQHAQTIPAKTGQSAEESLPSLQQMDLSELPSGLRDGIEKLIASRGETAAQEKLRGMIGEHFGWIEKDEREHFTKNRSAFRELKEKAAAAPRLASENQQLRSEIDQLRQSVTKPNGAVAPPAAATPEIDPSLFADLEKDGIAVNDEDRKFAHAIAKRTAAALQKGQRPALSREELVGLVREVVKDSRAEENFSEDSRVVTQHPAWRDPKTGAHLQKAVMGRIRMAEIQKQPIRFQDAFNAELAELTALMGTQSTTTPAAAPVAPAPAAPPPVLGEMQTQQTTREGQPNLDVHNDEDLFKYMASQPEVRDARR